MGMHNYGFLLDENVVRLKQHFPKSRAKTVYDYSLEGKPDARVIKTAGDEGLIIVTADGQYPEFFRKIGTERRGGAHLYGLVQIVPTDIERQKRLFPLREVESRMRLDGKIVTWTMVALYNLCVRVDEGRRVTVLRLPPCPCNNQQDRDAAEKIFGPVQ